MKKLADRWPVYYAAGNHEYRTGRLAEIKKLLTACGAVVLDGKCVRVAAGGQMVQIGGIDDPETGEENWEAQLSAAGSGLDGSHFSILLTHRPERVSDYADSGFDLVLAGHAHGGQWRLPGLINGVLAPNQGLFPSYAGGRYEIAAPPSLSAGGWPGRAPGCPACSTGPSWWWWTWNRQNNYEGIYSFLRHSGRIDREKREMRPGFLSKITILKKKGKRELPGGDI